MKSEKRKRKFNTDFTSKSKKKNSYSKPKDGDFLLNENFGEDLDFTINELIKNKRCYDPISPDF